MSQSWRTSTAYLQGVGMGFALSSLIWVLALLILF